VKDLELEDEPQGPDWEKLREGLRARLEQALDDVVRWEWQPFGVWLESAEPFAAERHGDSPTERRRPGWEPQNPETAVHYGWDRNDRLRIARRYTTYWGGVVPHEDDVFVGEHQGEADLVSIEHQRDRSEAHRLALRSIERRYRRDGRLRSVVRWLDDPIRRPLWVRETYEYDDTGYVAAAVLERHLDSRNQEVESGSPSVQVARLEAERDAAGYLICLHRREVVPPGERQLLWRRTDAEERRAGEQFLREQTAQAIAEWAGRLAPSEPAYCLAVAYDRAWPPALGIGTGEELRRWGPPDSDDRSKMMWNPAEFTCFDAEPAELATTAFVEAYRAASQGWGSQTADKLRRLCLDAAADLAVAASAQLSKTEPFVAYATDLELIDLDNNFRTLRLARQRRAIEAL
jgi:hypothetical protein